MSQTLHNDNSQAQKTQPQLIASSAISFLDSLPLSLREKLADLTPEELKQVMSATLEANKETESALYARLDVQFAYLHDVEIGTKDATQRYRLDPTVIYYWYKNHWIRRIKSGRGQGVQTTYDEGDIAVLAELNRLRKGNSPKPGPYRGGWTPPARW